MNDYDLVVVGTGPAGSSAAHQCRQAGMRVAIIDKKVFGGTCALRGCNPKKVLFEVTDAFHRAGRMKGLGLEGDIKINWKDMIDFKRTFTDPIPKSSEQSFLDDGIDTYHGAASFISEDEIRVDDQKIRFKQILLATGARPMPLGVKGEEHIRHSDDFLELDELPKKIVFIGGGFISFEFAQMAAFGGCEVHIIEVLDRPLKAFDGELVSLLMKHSQQLGVIFHLNTKPLEIKKEADSYIIDAAENDRRIKIDCDLVFHGAGRIPDIADLNLEKGNVKSSKRGIVVNEFFQSVSNSKVYAAGDVSATEGLPLTPVAGVESDAATLNIIKGNRKKADYGVMPSILFTQPKLAMIGLTQEKAAEDGLDVSVKTIDTLKWTTYQRKNEAYALAKTITDNQTGKLLGVHILGSNADQLINLFALVMKFNLSPEDIKEMIFAFPTTASDLESLL